MTWADVSFWLMCVIIGLLWLGVEYLKDLVRTLDSIKVHKCISDTEDNPKEE